MRSITSTFKTEKNKSANRPIFLYTIVDYDGATHDLCFAEYDADVTYAGVTYAKFPITHEYISENTQGEVDIVKITVSNVSRLIQSYLETYDLRGKKVYITMVWANQLADASAYLRDTYYIDSYSADEERVEFALSSKYDVLELELPARKYMRGYCSWKFKSTECAYAGEETTCNKTLQRCKALSNELRFGGFPSVPSDRVIAG